MGNYYDGTKLLSTKDINGRTPEIFMCTTNKTGGKTTYFSRLCVNRYRDNGSKFMLLNRFTYELDGCADKFFKDIKNLFFENCSMDAARKSGGIYYELYMNGKPCGYSVAINAADQIKKMSHLFNDTDRMFMDEFQSETNHYCPDEVKKFRAVHTAVARGRSKQVRYVPVYMASNPVTLLNPYYAAMGISNRLKEETHFLRGDGFVLEQGFVESASRAQRESGFNRAFGDDIYNAYQSQGVYLNDSKSFIDKPQGRNTYLATIKYQGTNYALREFTDLGIIYCDDRADMSFPNRISLTTDDHEINYVMLKRNDFFLTNMRFFFEHGCFRFKDLRCKDTVIKALSY